MSKFKVEKVKVWVIFPDDMPMQAELNVANCTECGHMVKLIFNPKYCSGCGAKLPKSVRKTPAF